MIVCPPLTWRRARGDGTFLGRGRSNIIHVRKEEEIHFSAPRRQPHKHPLVLVGLLFFLARVCVCMCMCFF